MSIKGIVIGTLVGIIGSFLASLVLMLLVLTVTGHQLADMVAYTPNDLLLGFDLVLSLACVFAGGML